MVGKLGELINLLIGILLEVMTAAHGLGCCFELKLKLSLLRLQKIYSFVKLSKCHLLKSLKFVIQMTIVFIIPRRIGSFEWTLPHMLFARFFGLIVHE